MTVNSLYIEYLQGVKITRDFEVFADVSVMFSLPQVQLYINQIQLNLPNKLPPKMLRVKGRVRDVVTYKNRTTRGALSRKGPDSSTL